MLFVIFATIFGLTTAIPIDGQSGCLFDGKVYSPGQQIVIQKCLGAMTCLGNNNYGNLQQWGGVCPQTRRNIDGQNGCFFNGRVYTPGEQVIFDKCLGAMTCLGFNKFDSLQQWGGICPTNPETRDVDGQSGCYFDGKVYAPQQDIMIPHCLGKMKCLGRNNLGQIIPLYGQCDTKREAVDGQRGCWFNGRVYSAGDKIDLGGKLEPITCLGHNLYSLPKDE